MMEDLLGIKNEVEAMLTAGGSGKYREGKLLDIVDLKDKDGRNTSTGEAQAKAVYASIEEWSILPEIGLPKFPVITVNTEHWDLVTEASWEFFDVVKSDPLPWLTKSVKEWESFNDYQNIRAFVSTVKVVNDAAERAIALAKDYYDILTTDSRVRSLICQVVEKDRMEFPDASKKTLNNRDK